MILSAVLFDMDGLLTDSEGYGYILLKNGGRQLGFELSDQLLSDMTGLNDTECVAMLKTHCPGLDGKRLLQIYHEGMYAASLRGEVPLKPGVRELLDVLDAHRVRRAVASSNERFLVESYLRGHGILDRFDALVCGDMIAQSKPAPDIYLAAADALGVRPENCLVLEDSPNGLKSGRAAGMRTCMVPDRIPFTETLKPYVDDVRDSLHDVIPLIAPWLS